uniref:Uncharacterized protein n=1 Tax=Glossina austeni TaxID=7395 RepID=A0A1A9ULB2_GLOAU
MRRDFEKYTPETKIEVDENGDEYEVKRFHIEGRAVNDGRSQCVITRRKRTTPTQPIEDEPRQQQVLFYYASEPIAEENHPNDKDIPFHSLKNQTNELTLAAVLNNDDNDETSSNERIKETGTESQQFLQQLPQYSSINNGLIVVHSYEPQKYQQQPQKVFALVPLPYGSLEEASEEFSSSGIWSIDEDDDGDDGDDDWEDISDDFVNSNNKNNKRPTKTRNKKKSNKKSSSNKNKRKNNNKIKSRVSTTIKPTNHKKSNRRGVKVPNRRKEPTYQKNRRHQYADIDEYDDIPSYDVSSAQTDDDQEADVNCIIIRKEFTTTTTPRPFWNIFGRNANGTSRSSDHSPKLGMRHVRFEHHWMPPVQQRCSESSLILNT